MKSVVAVLACGLVLFACSSTSSTAKPAGSACGADGECSSGACLDLPVVTNDGGCVSPGKACSLTCTGDDADCASLGATFKCFGGCGPMLVCGNTQ